METKGKQRIVAILSMILLAVLFCSCAGDAVSQSGTEDTSQETVVSGVLVPEGYVLDVSFEAAGEKSRMTDLQLMNNTLYYGVYTWDEEGSILTGEIYAQERGHEERLLLSLGKEDQKEPKAFTVGEDGSLYLLYQESDEQKQTEKYVLEKRDRELRELYCVEVAGDETDEEVLKSVNDLKVIDSGVCAMTWDGRVLFWNEDGACQESFSLWEGREEFYYSGLLRMGEEGLYAYQVQEGREEGESGKAWFYDLAAWREMDETERMTAKPLLIDLDSTPVVAGRYDMIYVWKGQGNGLYFGDRNGLWQLDPKSGLVEEAFSWQDAGLQPESVRAVLRQEDGSFLLYIFDTLEGENYWVALTAKPASQVSEKTELVLGVAGLHFSTDSLTSILDQVVSSYNRMHPECPVTVRKYENDSSVMDFQKELLNGEGPDILLESSTYFDMDNLLQKKAVVDLAPYLEAAKLVTAADIVPGILEQITKEGQIPRIPLSFSVGVLIVPDEVPEEVMTPKDLLSLITKDARYLDTMLYNKEAEDSLNVILSAGEIGRYVDETNQSCSFDSEEFIRLLEAVKTLKDLEWMGNWKMRAELFRDRQLTVIREELSCMADYLLMRDTFADCARIVGYPNSDRELRYPVTLYDWLGINNASEHKEEAWSFIEFCLSYTSKADKGSDRFAVTKDTFERQTRFDEETEQGYIFQSIYSGEYFDWENTAFTTKEETDWLRGLTGHLFYFENDNLMKIITEEAAAYFAGDKSAQEAAKIIQSRVSLLIGE